MTSDGEGTLDVELYLDDATTPFATHSPPATVELDTTHLADGRHVLRIRAREASGRFGIRTVAFQVQNGPGITITGLRSDELVSGKLQLQVNAFSSSDPFDPTRAESSGPIPVWTWVLITLIAAWAGWYALTEFQEPAGFAQGSTSNPLAAAIAPMRAGAPPAYGARGTAAGFDYTATGASLYTANCSACHGASGTGVPGAFPPLAGDAVVDAQNPGQQIAVILHGLHGKTIGGTTFASQMPSFSQLSDNDIAAIVDHERTSWGNAAPLASPNDVKHSR